MKQMSKAAVALAVFLSVFTALCFAGYFLTGDALGVFRAIWERIAEALG